MNFCYVSSRQESLGQECQHLEVVFHLLLFYQLLSKRTDYCSAHMKVKTTITDCFTLSGMPSRKSDDILPLSCSVSDLIKLQNKIVSWDCLFLIHLSVVAQLFSVTSKRRKLWNIIDYDQSVLAPGRTALLLGWQLMDCDVTVQGTRIKIHFVGTSNIKNV